MTQENTSELWEYQEDFDTPLAYDRFKYYLTLGPTRTLRQVAERYEVSIQAIVQMSAKFKWVSRAEAWEVYYGRGPKLGDVIAEQYIYERRGVDSDEARDYDELLVLFRKKVHELKESEVYEVKDVVSLIRARDQLSLMARRAISDDKGKSSDDEQEAEEKEELTGYRVTDSGTLPVTTRNKLSADS